jgi:hypothetical protein
LGALRPSPRDDLPRHKKSFWNYAKFSACPPADRTPPVFQRSDPPPPDPRGARRESHRRAPRAGRWVSSSREENAPVTFPLHPSTCRPLRTCIQKHWGGQGPRPARHIIETPSGRPSHSNSALNSSRPSRFASAAALLGGRGRSGSKVGNSPKREGWPRGCPVLTSPPPEFSTCWERGLTSSV